MKIVPVTGKPPATQAAVDRFLAAPRLMRLGVTAPMAQGDQLAARCVGRWCDRKT